MQCAENSSTPRSTEQSLYNVTVVESNEQNKLGPPTNVITSSHYVSRSAINIPKAGTVPGKSSVRYGQEERKLSADDVATPLIKNSNVVSSGVDMRGVKFSKVSLPNRKSLSATNILAPQQQQQASLHLPRISPLYSKSREKSTPLSHHHVSLDLGRESLGSILLRSDARRSTAAGVLPSDITPATTTKPKRNSLKGFKRRSVDVDTVNFHEKHMNFGKVTSRSSDSAWIEHNVV